MGNCIEASREERTLERLPGIALRGARGQSAAAAGGSRTPALGETMPSILILLPWEPSIRGSFEKLIRAHRPDMAIETVGTLAEAREKIVDADIFMAFGAAVTQDIFPAARKLKWVHAFGTGVDGIADRAGLDPTVIVTSTRGIHGAPLSEIAILHMLSMARNFPRSIDAHRAHKWDRFRARILDRKKVGILGVGLIAEALAPRLKGLGMHVVGLSRTARDLGGFDEWRPRDPLVAHVGDLDWLVLLAPYDQTTHHIVDAQVLAAMKKGACLVNIARGGLIDETALREALDSGHLGGAALDTVTQEPLPANDPLWAAKNLVITPHLGGFYETYPEDCIEQIVHNLDCFLEGRTGEMMNLEVRG